VTGSVVLVLGVDPGSVRTGWGVVQVHGSRLVGVAAGVIEADDRAELAERLRVIQAGLSAVIAEHRPGHMAVEDVFVKHARSALVLGHARGVILLTGHAAGLPIAAYPPAVVKRSVAGRGAADKAQLGRLVAAMLGLRDQPRPDATDALAIAITHAHALRVPEALRAKRGRFSETRKRPRP
jgi:crossover junction endodeoxyribonuclease RuvC